MVDVEHRWLWPANVTRVIDGDTIDVEIDTGFRTVRYERLRLFGVNCPEIHGVSHDAGLAAKKFTTDWCSVVPAGMWPFTIETFKTDVFGRWLARVWHGDRTATDDSVELTQALLQAGHAVPFRK